MNPEREPKEGELYELKDGHGWCRHGLVIILRKGDKIYAVDTYWGGGFSDNMVRNWSEMHEVKGLLTFLLDLTAARDSHRDEWEIFADEDRAHIPQGGGRERFYVLKDARPNFVRQVARLERLIQAKLDAADSAKLWALGYQKELQELKDKHVHRPSVQGPCSPECQTCAAALAPKPSCVRCGDTGRIIIGSWEGPCDARCPARREDAPAPKEAV